MPLRRQDKQKMVDEFKSLIDNSSGFLVFDYRGLNVSQISALRSKVRESNSTLRIIRNRMLKLAVSDQPYQEINQILTGPSAVIFAGPDPVAPAKALVDYAKDFEFVKIKGGVVNGRFMDAGQVELLSKVPPLEQLQAKILGGIKAPASNILGGIKGLSNKLHGLMKAYVEKLEQAA